MQRQQQMRQQMLDLKMQQMTQQMQEMQQMRQNLSHNAQQNFPQNMAASLALPSAVSSNHTLLPLEEKTGAMYAPPAETFFQTSQIPQNVQGQGISTAIPFPQGSLSPLLMGEETTPLSSAAVTPLSAMVTSTPAMDAMLPTTSFSSSKTSQLIRATVDQSMPPPLSTVETTTAAAAATTTTTTAAATPTRVSESTLVSAATSTGLIKSASTSAPIPASAPVSATTPVSAPVPTPSSAVMSKVLEPSEKDNMSMPESLEALMSHPSPSSVLTSNKTDSKQTENLKKTPTSLVEVSSKAVHRYEDISDEDSSEENDEELRGLKENHKACEINGVLVEGASASEYKLFISKRTAEQHLRRLPEDIEEVIVRNLAQLDFLRAFNRKIAKNHMKLKEELGAEADENGQIQITCNMCSIHCPMSHGSLKFAGRPPKIDQEKEKTKEKRGRKRKKKETDTDKDKRKGNVKEKESSKRAQFKSKELISDSDSD